MGRKSRLGVGFFAPDLGPDRLWLAVCGANPHLLGDPVLEHTGGRFRHLATTVDMYVPLRLDEFVGGSPPPPHPPVRAVRSVVVVPSGSYAERAISGRNLAT